MARRILSADTALLPQVQNPLGVSVRTEAEAGLPLAVRERWIDRAGPPEFDWEDRTALLAEIAFVNRVQEFVDETAIKIAPSVLRIVLTVKRNLPDPAGQRAFLAEHLALDLRRVSELCIVAETYRLLDPREGAAGEHEIARYGWSKALKLAYVRDPDDRRDIWERACAEGPVASYRAVLEGIRRYRERQQVLPFPPSWPLAERLDAARSAFAAFDGAARRLTTSDACQEALRELGRVRRELDSVKRVLRERIETLAHDEMANEA